MLKELPTETIERNLIRLAVCSNPDRFFAEQDLDAQSIEETKQLLKSQGIVTQPQKLIEKLFTPKHWTKGMKRFATRYSDGSFPVLYGALEAQTAEAEIKHWFSRRVSGDPTCARTAWYTRIRYRFSGKVKDLTPKQVDWPALTHDNDYKFCNELGAEAVASDLDGLLAPSARNEGGTNLPAFAKRAVSHFSKDGVVAVTYDPQAGETLVSEVGGAWTTPGAPAARRA